MGLLDHEISQVDGAATLVLAGELDLSVADELRSLLDAYVRDHSPRIRVDLAGVRFIDSRTIGVLIGAQKRAEAAGGGLRVTNPQPTVRKAFDILGLSPVFEIN